MIDNYSLLFSSMSKQMKTIDLRKLASNFAQEKSAEERYWQRNDAKFRAVHQRCANYDEFRQIVQAAHLRPLDRNETLTLQRQPTAWNQPAANPSSSEVTIPSKALENQSIVLVKPKNQTEFLQQWRRIPNEMKFDYLRQLDDLENLFHLDIPTDFVDDLSMLYHADSSLKDATIIINILSVLPKSKRFDLMKSFWTSQTRFHLDVLFTRLFSHVQFRPSIFLLKFLYIKQ